MSKKIKVGDIVIVNNCNTLGIKDGSLGTVMELNYRGDDTIFINTEKLNDYNHSEYNGNGVIVHIDKLTVVSSSPDKKETNKTRWSKKEITYLHANYRRKSVSVISEKLGRSYYAVQSKARDEGIHNHPRREYNEYDNHHIIHSIVDKKSSITIGKQLHRTKSSIDGRIRLMNKLNMLPTLKESK